MPDATPDAPPTRAERIEATLTAALQPTRLAVQDESAKHAGHGGARAGGQTHYRVDATSARFDGLNRLERSRLVHTLLADEFATGLHALSLGLNNID